MNFTYEESIAIKNAIYPRIEDLFHDYLDCAVLRPMKADAIYTEIETLLSIAGRIEKKIDDEDAIRYDLRAEMEDAEIRIPAGLED